MSNRHVIAAVMLTVFAIPAAAQSNSSHPSTTDTTKKSTTTTNSSTTITTSNGAIADTVKANSSVTTTTVDTTLKAPAPVTGLVTPSTAPRVDVKVASTLASTAKVSGDSAFVLARAIVPDGEVSSAKLEMEDGRLVYTVKLLQKNKGASEVRVDAMTGEVVKDKRFGGAKAMVEHHKENAKLLDAKKDSAAKKPY
jgi:uncharacterized membrane protein YkoI